MSSVAKLKVAEVLLRPPTHPSFPSLTKFKNFQLVYEMQAWKPRAYCKFSIVYKPEQR